MGLRDDAANDGIINIMAHENGVMSLFYIYKYREKERIWGI